MDDLISNHEKNFIIDGMREGMRNDGRSLTDYRPIALRTGILPGSNGSALVLLGATQVLVVVKAELTTIEQGEPMPGRLKFFVDISANASPKFAGRGGNEMAEELAKTLAIAFSNELALPDIGKLLLTPTHFWTLNVDALILQCDGNPMDAVSLGVKAALHDTEICNVVVRPADEGKMVIDLPDETSGWKFDISRVPLVVAVNWVGAQDVFDVDSSEELCSTSTLFVGVLPAKSQHPNGDEDEQPVITCIKKIKGGSLEVDSISEMLEKAVGVAAKLNASLMRKLAQEAKIATTKSIL